MVHQNQDVVPSSKQRRSKPDLEQGQQVRILHGQYRGTVGSVSRTEWSEVAGEWLYDVSEGKVYVGQYRSKELW